MFEKLKKYKYWDSIALGAIIGFASTYFDSMYTLLIFTISMGLTWGLIKSYFLKQKKNNGSVS